MAEVAYYFNSYNASDWIDPTKGIDGSLITYAVTTSKGAIFSLDGNTCGGADLGTITKVELRVHGYGDGNDRIDIRFAAGGYNSDYNGFTMPTSPDWTTYWDITGDPVAPNPWLWSHILGMTSRFLFTAVGKSNTMYCAQVEIRVTYTPSGGGYYHGLKVQGEGELALCDVGSSPLRMRKGGTTYGLELVATGDPNASRIRIQTGSGIKAIRKYS